MKSNLMHASEETPKYWAEKLPFSDSHQDIYSFFTQCHNSFSKPQIIKLQCHNIIVSSQNIHLSTPTNTIYTCQKHTTYLHLRSCTYTFLYTLCILNIYSLVHMYILPSGSPQNTCHSSNFFLVTTFLVRNPSTSFIEKAHLFRGNLKSLSKHEPNSHSISWLLSSTSLTIKRYSNDE